MRQNNIYKSQYFYDSTKKLWKVEIISKVNLSTVDYLYGATEAIIKSLKAELDRKYHIGE